MSGSPSPPPPPSLRAPTRRHARTPGSHPRCFSSVAPMRAHCASSSYVWIHCAWPRHGRGVGAVRAAQDLGWGDPTPNPADRVPFTLATPPPPSSATISDTLPAKSPSLLLACSDCSARTTPAFGFSKAAKLGPVSPRSGADYVSHAEIGRGSPSHKVRCWRACMRGGGAATTRWLGGCLGASCRSVP